MKKFIIAFGAALTLISTTAFAGGKEKVNPALSTFQNEFKGATDVKWQQGKNVITAGFNFNGLRTEAYFTYDGELLGTARNVLFNQLPLAVIKQIDTRFGTAPVYDIIEFSAGSETFYQMIVELPKKKLEVRATSGGDISVLRKIK
ncbi:MAG: hypothetical protein E6H06_07405 [Bacteroidetes bacterium]|nr:MAG: hypothetical protein E6H06_07405 [Bacteroidota bacterium]